MNLLLIGSGGREHALAWKLAKSTKVSRIFVAPGNAGTAVENKCENVDCSSIPELILFAKNNEIDLTVVGPEALLVEGIADAFQAENLPIFAPNKKAAQLEGSKRFSKDFMQKHNVKTANYAAFTTYNDAIDHLTYTSYPTVVKASGLAAGKGVVICQTQDEAKQALTDMMQNGQFGQAGEEVVIEEFLEGFEASILSICDGKTILPFISAKDHKKIGEGETGLNTGGMGVVAPNPLLTEEQYQEFLDEIAAPTLKGLQAEGIDFIGVIFFGLMITVDGVHLLEYNVRFGDPETQAVLPLLENDLLEIIQACVTEELDDITLRWKDGASCCVVAASGGYPKAYEKNKEITIGETPNSTVFLAGATTVNNQMHSSGGRVLNVVSTASSLELARDQAYKDLRNVHFENMVYRTDIGLVESSTD